MGKMKNELMNEVDKNMALIANAMDGEYDYFLTEKIHKAYHKLSEVMQEFAVIRATLEEIENYEVGNIWEQCCEMDEEFEELWYDLEKIEDILE